MEIRRWVFYVVVNCVFVCIVAKSISLNELIEAESQQKGIVQTITTKSEEPESKAERFSFGLKPVSRKLTEHKRSEPETTAERFPFELKPVSRKLTEHTRSEPESTPNRFSLGFKPVSRKLTQHKRSGTFIPLGKKVSPLKYRKTFEIKSPLKPKRVKNSLRLRQKSRSQSLKREVKENVKLKQKYIPLLRSLGLLFDNILGSDSSESIEVPRVKRKRLRYYSTESTDVDEPSCKCSSKSSSRPNPQSEQEATSSETFSTKVSVTPEITTQTAHHFATSNISSFRHDKILPLLLPRNTFGARRNNNGLGARSSTAYNGSAERDITRDNGVSEPDPERREDEASSRSDEEHSNSNPRNRTGSFEFGGGIRERKYRNITKEDSEPIQKSEAEIHLDGDRGLAEEFKGYDKLETDRDETKSAELLSKPIRRLRGFLPEDEISPITRSIQSKEDNEESNFDVTLDSSDDQRIIERSGATATEVQEISSRHEILDHREPEHDISMRTPRNKVPVVVIIDGYSVTRHKNGENKLSEKSSHIHST